MTGLDGLDPGRYRQHGFAGAWRPDQDQLFDARAKARPASSRISLRSMTDLKAEAELLGF
jgi:hypothetical protein